MIQTRHHLGFSLDTIRFNHVEAGLVDNLDSHLHTSRQMLSKFYESKATFADLPNDTI